jgi:hypothetical protein
MLNCTLRLCLSFVLLSCGAHAPSEAPVTQPPVEAVVPEPAPEPASCSQLDTDDAWTQALLDRALKDSPIMADPAAHRLQVLVGEIPAAGCLKWHPYRLDAEYIYPASAIKPIAAVGALSAFRQRQAEHPELASVGLNTQLRQPGARAPKLKEGEAPPPPPTIANQIRDSLSVSSNPAYNFTVDLAGVGPVHELMWASGLESVKLRHRLSLFGLTEKDQRTTPQIMALTDSGEVELVPRRVSEVRVPPHGRAGSGVGIRHRVRGERAPVEAPKDFSMKNSVSLMDMARLTAWIARPELQLGLDFPLLQAEDRALLQASMSHVHEDWSAWIPLRLGLVEAVAGSDLRIIHKSGMAYGFYLDISFVEQPSTGRAFILAVAAYLNPNGTVNDGEYGYESLGNPMMQALGEQLGREILLGQAP